MRPGVAISLALGLLGSDLVATSVCRPQCSFFVFHDNRILERIYDDLRGILGYFPGYNERDLIFDLDRIC
ncbi:hypothetical protein CEP53_005204 [Fusarium sp. AF-6]|nr:hypothetical protein CEP53_005204 [Fusarium sp. AF-6]